MLNRLVCLSLLCALFSCGSPPEKTPEATALTGPFCPNTSLDPAFLIQIAQFSLP